MPDLIQVEPFNSTFMRVYSSDGIESELGDFFTFNVPGARFTPKYKAGIWDGKIRLYNRSKKTLYVGLIDYLRKFAGSRDYQLVEHHPVMQAASVSREQVEQYLNDLQPTASDGSRIAYRDYQVDAAWHAIRDGRVLLLSPTASGKSLIIYGVLRWMMDYGENKAILIVPTTALVEQMWGDFKDYSQANHWDVEAHCQRIYQGHSKQIQFPITISTWQSLQKQPARWFKQFSLVIGDEAHKFKSTALKSILEAMTEVSVRIGTTGTLDGLQVNQLQLEGLFGPVYRVTTTKKLIDSEQLTPIKITGVILKYPEEVCKLAKAASYDQEIQYLIGNETRTRFIAKLATRIDGNTLVLFRYIEKHGDKLLAEIKAVAPGKQVFIYHGGISTEERERIRHIAIESDNVILVASFATFATGLNVPSIENIIFAAPMKSKVTNLQSIGRGLRLKSGKEFCNLYDICDDMHWKRKLNFALQHASARYKLYAEEQFPLKLVEVQLR